MDNVARGEFEAVQSLNLNSEEASQVSFDELRELNRASLVRLNSAAFSPLIPSSSPFPHSAGDATY